MKALFQIFFALVVLLAPEGLFNCSGQETNPPAQLMTREQALAYKAAMEKAMLAEANIYIKALKLADSYPISESNLQEEFISSPYVARRFGALGTLETENYSYSFGNGRRLSYIIRRTGETNIYSLDFNKRYAIRPIDVNTNAAYLDALQYLTNAFVNVSHLVASSEVSVKPLVILNMTTSEYTVEWNRAGRTVVKVFLIEPARELRTLRVEDPDLILRKPLQIPNIGN